MASDLLAQLQEILGDTYRVDRELGGAGMSRVFLAHEVGLERQVVVKVLPPDLAAGINADRFRREIQLAARLQHPHIVPLLAAGSKGGLLYYTMPFIAGENLRARLSRVRELPVGEATKILREVADALEYAHEQGVVHRDIKPENILFSGNHALVTDFGVSKALSSATSETRVAGSPALTSLGIALGTPTYMAPEQAVADPQIDHRADIYSLGVVGYELLAGRPPFTGTSQQQILSAQVTATPEPISNFRPNLPPALAAAIMRCLEKRPSDRWQTAAELRTQLETIFTPSGATQPVMRSVSKTATVSEMFRPTPKRVMIAAAFAGVVIAGLVLSTFAFKKDDAAFSVAATHQVTNMPGIEVYPALSPDGKTVAYVSPSPTGKAQIFLRQATGGRAVPLTDGTSDALNPIWKPDGSALTYTDQDGTQFSIPPLGGSPTAIIGKSAPNGPFVLCDWSPTGANVVCSSGKDASLYVGGPNGENFKRLTPPAHDFAHLATWSPDGKRIAYVLGNVEFIKWGGTLGNTASSSIWIVPASGGDPVRVTDEGHLNTSPVWAPDGDHILYVSSLGGARDIYSQRVKSNGHPDGNPVRLTTGLNPHTISISRDGKYLAYSAFTTAANVWSAAISGMQPISASSMRQITFGNQTVESMGPSSDGQWLGYDSNVNGNADVYKVSLTTKGAEPQQLTHDPSDDFFDDWSPDGSQIVFHSFRNGNRDLFVMSADGTGADTVVATPSQERAAQWAPDGKSMIYLVLPDSLFTVKRAGTRWGKPDFVMLGGSARWSPDGKYIALGANDGLRLRTVGGTDEKLFDWGKYPEIRFGMMQWSRDSKVIYLAADLADRTTGVYGFDVQGRAMKPLLHFTDPLRQLFRNFDAVDAKNIYFPMGTRESDIWVMELNRK